MSFSDLRDLRTVTASASIFVLVALATGCGGTVVFDDNGSGGSGASRGDGGSSSDATNATTLTSVAATTSGQGDGGADVISTAIATSSAVLASSSTGQTNPCLGLACGEECVVCNEFECLSWSCDELQTCVPEQVCPPPTETLCYAVDPGERCASIEDAPFALCRDCGGGKGCTFFGEVFEGPFVTPDACCYEVDGECAPNP